MERYKETEIVVDHNKMTSTELKELMDKVANKEIELVPNNEGKVKGWCKDKSYALEKTKAGKMEITARFPEIYNEKCEQVTPKNLKDTDLAKTKTPQEVAQIKAEEAKAKEIEKFAKELEGMTKAELEKEYGVSQKQTKDKMIADIIANLNKEGDI